MHQAQSQKQFITKDAVFVSPEESEPVPLPPDIICIIYCIIHNLGEDN